jgi:hypothetical protein
LSSTHRHASWLSFSVTETNNQAVYDPAFFSTLLAKEFDLTHVRIRPDGALIVHTTEPGYRAVARLSAMASDAVGREVLVITDDVPGAAEAQEF